MANTGNILDKIPEQKLSSSTGSTFIRGNTSYSGADIKVTVQIYDNNLFLEDEAARLVGDLEIAQNILRDVNGQIADTRNKIEASKPGTPERFSLQTTLSALITERNQLQAGLRAIENEHTNISKDITQATTKTLAEVQTLSLSIFRDKQAVRSLGSVYPKAFTRGPREIGGTIIFTVFDEHVLYRFLEAHASDFDAYKGTTSALLDQLPPVDINVSFANEYGSVSRLTILGVEFVEEGQTMSIEDILTENVVTYVARDIDPMRSVKQRKLDNSSRLINEFNTKTASDLILEEDYQRVKNATDPYARLKARRNPFL